MILCVWEFTQWVISFPDFLCVSCSEVVWKLKSNCLIACPSSLAGVTMVTSLMSRACVFNDLDSGYQTTTWERDCNSTKNSVNSFSTYFCNSWFVTVEQILWLWTILHAGHWSRKHFSLPPVSFPKLFQRCLMTVLNLDLWKCYISYVKETKSSLRTFRWALIGKLECTKILHWPKSEGKRKCACAVLTMKHPCRENSEKQLNSAMAKLNGIKRKWTFPIVYKGQPFYKGQKSLSWA